MNWRLAYAKSLLRTGNGKKLDEQLKRLEEGRRDDAHSMMLLGMIAEEARLYERAELYYKRYLVLLSKAEKTALLPDTAYVRLGMVKLAQGDRKAAIEWLDRVEGGDKYEAARIKQAELLARIRQRGQRLQGFARHPHDGCQTQDESGRGLRRIAFEDQAVHSGSGRAD